MCAHVNCDAMRPSRVQNGDAAPTRCMGGSQRRSESHRRFRILQVQSRILTVIGSCQDPKVLCVEVADFSGRLASGNRVQYPLRIVRQLRVDVVRKPEGVGQGLGFSASSARQLRERGCMSINLRSRSGAGGSVVSLHGVDCRVVRVYEGASLLGYAESHGAFSLMKGGMPSIVRPGSGAGG